MAANKHIRIKHGHSPKHRKSKTYTVWRSMMQRCYRTKEKAYAHYGAKGIVVCKRWHDFRNFLADMGETPDGLTIDRIDSAGNYEPNNCRWATRIVQTRNRSVTKLTTYNGITKPTAEWAEILGINYRCLRGRLDNGWSVERAFSTPILSYTQAAILGAQKRWRSAIVPE